MGFFKVETKKQFEKSIKFTVSTTKKDEYRAALSIPQSIGLNLMANEVERLDVFAGDGDDLGKLLFVPTDKADSGIKVANMKFSLVLRLPALSMLTRLAHSECGLKAEKTDHAGAPAFVVHLPKWAFDQDEADALVRGQTIGSLVERGARAVRNAQALPSPVRKINPADLVYPTPDYTSAPLGTKPIWEALVAAAKDAGSTVVSMSNLSLARAARVDGSRIVNAVTWLAANKCINSKAPIKIGDPTTYTLLAEVR